MTKNKLVLLMVILLIFAFGLFTTANAQDQNLPQTEIESGDVVCSPGMYRGYTPGGCLPTGPSETLTKNPTLELPLAQPSTAYKPEDALNYVPFSYFKVDEGGTMLYPSLDNAASRSGAISALGPGFVFVNYIDRAETPGGVFYYLANGNWIAGEGSRISPGIFQGFAMSATPRTAFGWILSQNESRTQPDYAITTSKVTTYYRYQVVPVLKVETIGDTEWYMIAQDEWIEGRVVSAVFPNPIAPEGVTNGRWIEVNLAEQTLAVYDNNQMVYATLVSSGLPPFWTKPGLFQIYAKKETENMQGAFEADRSDFYYLQSVPWTMYYDKARALHGAYWHTLLGYPQSHGCVNLSLGDANWLFHWANEGDWVWVHDPSGVTPTDPKKYGDGGA